MMESAGADTQNIVGRVAVIIPAYQEEKHVAEVVRRTLEQVDQVLVVDDGSTDETALRRSCCGSRRYRPSGQPR